ncbi:MAG: cysteine synthase A [Clostridiales bacterium]|nr:cysteine synthase A [Clostridiales bacterium]
MRINNSVDELIGGTPILRLHNIEREYSLKARILAKLEYFNPTGSVKDRIAKAMIDSGEACGKLKSGSVIIEPTSGNTGIGLAAVGVSRGYRVIIVMPETMSIERRQLISAYGAEIVLTDGSKGMRGAVEKARELAAATPDSFIPNQFENPSNPDVHYRTTGPEIWRDTDGNIDALVAGVGTGGTVSGAGAFLKSQNPNIRTVAVEPASSPVLSGGRAGAHKIQGIGAGFVPKTFDAKVCDEVMTVSNDDAFLFSREVGKKEGVLVGISSGAALAAAVRLAKRDGLDGKTVVVVFPDSGDRYLSVAR